MKAEWTNKDSLTSEETTKAILVIDEMPKMCVGCPLNLADSSIKCRHTWTVKAIPDWCPLKPLPQKKIGDDLYEKYGSWTPSDEREVSYRLGFNDCIEEITGETE